MSAPLDVNQLLSQIWDGTASECYPEDCQKSTTKQQIFTHIWNPPQISSLDLQLRTEGFSQNLRGRPEPSQPIAISESSCFWHLVHPRNRERRRLAEKGLPIVSECILVKLRGLPSKISGKSFRSQLQIFESDLVFEDCTFSKTVQFTDTKVQFRRCSFGMSVEGVGTDCQMEDCSLPSGLDVFGSSDYQFVSRLQLVRCYLDYLVTYQVDQENQGCYFQGEPLADNKSQYNWACGPTGAIGSVGPTREELKPLNRKERRKQEKEKEREQRRRQKHAQAG